jgi:hypothetical protein
VDKITIKTINDHIESEYIANKRKGITDVKNSDMTSAVIKNMNLKQLLFHKLIKVHVLLCYSSLYVKFIYKITDLLRKIKLLSMVFKK